MSADVVSEHHKAAAVVIWERLNVAVNPLVGEIKLYNCFNYS